MDGNNRFLNHGIDRRKFSSNILKNCDLCGEQSTLYKGVCKACKNMVEQNARRVKGAGLCA